MQRRIRVIMAEMETYDEHYNNGFGRYPNVFHTLLSNCHRRKDWIEIGIEEAIRRNKDILMIGVDC